MLLELAKGICHLLNKHKELLKALAQGNGMTGVGHKDDFCGRCL